jgi:hypothetical protein
MAKCKIGQAVTSGYWNATRTVICQYCSKIRSVENIHTRKPRIKCKFCHEKRQGFK